MRRRVDSIVQAAGEDSKEHPDRRARPVVRPVDPGLGTGIPTAAGDRRSSMALPHG